MQPVEALLRAAGNVLKIHDGGSTSEKTLIDEQELKDAIKKHFGLSVDFPLRSG